MCYLSAVITRHTQHLSRYTISANFWNLSPFTTEVGMRLKPTHMWHVLPPQSALRATLLTCAAMSSTLHQEYYEHDGWRLGFRHIRAAPGREAEPPLLLVHPVGIGLDSWFWDRFIGGR